MLKKTVKYIGFILLAFTSGIAGSYFLFTKVQTFNNSERGNHEESVFASNNYGHASVTLAPVESFAEACKKSTKSVVYIRSVAQGQVNDSFYDWFFGGQRSQAPAVSSGSGVIYTPNGYIITNNHVIEGAQSLEVIHEKRTYKAQVVGTDPSTDIAVLKIESDNLPNISLGTSRTLNVGDWVIAVGNPFNLTSTVTAGIVSAKGREINIMKGRFPIESFIQTDAAINPGNSGGALVNRNGELVGINTAILSYTGSYAGYGFAVPIDVAKKVVEDLIEYGQVQKAFVGLELVEISEQLATEYQLSDRHGVIIANVQKESAGEKSDIKKGDVITSVDDFPVESRADFDEILGYHSPGDEIKITINRNGKVVEKYAVATNMEGTTGIIKREVVDSQMLGCELESVSKVERDLLRINNGVKITKVKNGVIRKLGIEDGFIVTNVNDQKIEKPEDLTLYLEKARGKTIIQGVNKEGVRGYYSFYF